MTEDDHQIAFAKWMNYAYPHVLWFHTPNGGSRNSAEAKKLRAMGVKRGIPDILIIHPLGDSPGLAIELKVGRNKATAEQVEILQRLADMGWHAWILYGWEKASEVAKAYLIGEPIIQE